MLFAGASHLTMDPEVLSHWARYITVLVSGYLEVSVQSTLDLYAQKRSSPSVASFVSDRLEGFVNLNSDRIGQLLGAFDSSWRESFETFLDEEKKAAVNSVVGLRNTIAHGRDTGVTLGSIQRYYQQCDLVVSFIENLCSP